MKRFRSQGAYGAASNTAVALCIVALIAVLAVAAFGRQTAIKPSPSQIPTPSAVHPVAGQPATAAAAAGAPKAVTPAGSDDYAIFDGSDVISYTRTGITTAKKFTYTEQDRVVTGDAAKYNSKTKELDADGNLVMDDPKHHMTATHCHVDQKKKLSVFAGSVVIELKPAKPQPTPAEAPVAASPTERTSPSTPPPTATGKNASADQGASSGGGELAGKADPKSDAKSDAALEGKSEGKEDADDFGSEKSHGVTIYCDHADDYYKKDFIVLTGHLVFKQKVKKDDGSTVERTLTAEHAEYDGSKDEMVLFSPVSGHDSDGATLEFEKNAIIGTKEGDETLKSDGHTTIHFPVDELKDKDSQPPSGAKKGDGRTNAPPKKPAAPQPASGSANSL